MKEVSSYKVENINEGSILLNGNESPLNYDMERIAFIVKRLKDEDLNRYPDSESNELRELYAKYIKVEKDNLIAGHGSDEMLSLIISKYISKNKNLYTLSPDFSMYDFYCSLNEGDIIKYKTEEDGFVDIDKFIKYGLENDISLVMLSNPNNPTGYLINKDEIKKILNAFNNIPVVIDEAYMDFSSESCISLINKYDNLIVTRTLSKAWGLASLRVGFLVTNKKLRDELNKYKVPYNVSAMSQVVACNILENEDVNENIEKIMCWKEEFYDSLKAIEKESCISIKFYKGNANFIYGRCDYKDSILSELERRKIKIRNFSDDTFRITVGVPMQNRQVVDAIKKACIYEEEF